jgi:Fe-S-cluster-containing dehydrogenase component
MSVDRKEFLRMAGMSLATLVAPRSTMTMADASEKGGASAAHEPAARRWAMVIDTRKCAQQDGCSSCIKACNRSHNIPEIHEEGHEVQWVRKEPFQSAFHLESGEFANASLRDRPVLVLCNHCDKPPCVRVCPTRATWKREDGIVMMDWHRCIGCRYCMAACPYGSRSFNWIAPRPFIHEASAEFPTRSKGVVEKCTFCVERLAQGKPPACVAACEAGALLFGDLEDNASPVRVALGAGYAIRRKPELGTVPKVYYIV